MLYLKAFSHVLTVYYRVDSFSCSGRLLQCRQVVTIVATGVPDLGLV